MSGPLRDGPGSVARSGAAALSGERQLDFAVIVKRYEAPLLRYVGNLLPSGTAEKTEDIVQETFLRLHRQTEKRGEDSIKKLSTWLFRVAHNLVMDARRKRLRETKAQKILADETPGGATGGDGIMDNLVQREACERAMAELAELPEKQREVLLLKITQDLKLREIAEVMDISISNVAYHMNLGLQRLSRRLKTAGVI